jgi:hypothetical protein
VSFHGRIRRWRADKPGGLAVIDIPLELVAELGWRRQTRVAGLLNGVPSPQARCSSPAAASA